MAENWLGNSTRASYTYDAAGRLVTLRNLQPDDSLLSGFQYLLDATGNRVGVIEADGSRTTWTHDAAYQLTSEHRTGALSFRITHVYDPAGNRLVHFDDGACTTYTYDAANQLFTSDDVSGRTSYTYDAAGNLVIQAAPSGRTTNIWDGENCLIRVQLPSGVANTMTYTPDGLRTVKEGTSGATKFVWDNQNVLLETDASNTVEVAYSLSPDLYGKLLDQVRLGVWRYYHFDGIDSTVGLSDTDGQFLDNYVYEAFGSLRSSSGSTVNPFRWVGGLGYYLDADAGQYYIRARHYDSRFARWLSEDPIGYHGGINLYHYVGSSPLTHTDPEGKQIIIIAKGVCLLIQCRCGDVEVECKTGKYNIPVYGRSGEAGLIHTGGSGCIADPHGTIRCTGSCKDIKSWMSSGNPKATILEHEACHICALKDDGFKAYVETWGASPDPCVGKERPAVPKW